MRDLLFPRSQRIATNMTMATDKVAVKGYKQTLIGFLETFSTKTTSRGCRCFYSPSCREEVFSETQRHKLG
jgi:hypothetical protein